MLCLCCAEEEEGNGDAFQTLSVDDPDKETCAMYTTGEQFEQLSGENTLEDDVEFSSRRFTVSVHRSKNSKIGMRVEHGEWISPNILLVADVKEGLIQTWNSEHQDLKVEVGDFIISVNGKKGSSKALLDELLCQTKVTLVIEKALREQEEELEQEGSENMMALVERSL